jgi:hypothetical protein
MTRLPLLAAALAIAFAAPVAAQTSVTAGLTVDGTVITIQVDRPTAAQRGPAYGSYRQMRGSRVGLVAEGSSRRFHYVQPRADLAKAGVRPGTTLFEGHRFGDSYEGRAWIFNERCGPHSYTVSGAVSLDNRMVVLWGIAPIYFDEACNATQHDWRESVYILE